MNYEEFLLTKASFVDDVITILSIKRKHGLSLTEEEKELRAHIFRFKIQKIYRITEAAMTRKTITKSCQNCAYRKGEFGYTGLCLRSGIYCSMQRRSMDSMCDRDFSGWAERPKPWILRLLGL